MVFDLETTGISPAKDKIIEIAAIKIQKDLPIQEFSSLVNPETRIPFSASQINGITDDFVADAPSIETVLPEFLEFLGELPLVGHNINSFDLKFIERECTRLYGKTVCNDHIDTLPLAKICLPELSHHRLTDLAEYFHIATDGAHRALNDCRMNRQVYELLCETLRQTKAHIPNCPKCGSLLVKRNGKFGVFESPEKFYELSITRIMGHGN